MGNFAEAGKIKDEMKKRDATRREKLAGYFFDLSKLIFAGMRLSQNEVTPKSWTS